MRIATQALTIASGITIVAAALMAIGPVRAQERPVEPVAPRVLVPPPPVYVGGGPSAPSCIPSNAVSIGPPGGQLPFCLRTAGFAVPRLIRTDDVGQDAWRVDNATALALLADRRYETIWPALERAMGANRTTIRDAVVREAQQAYSIGFPTRGASNTLESINSGQIRLVLDFALALSQAGRTEEALQLLRRQLPDVDSRRRNFDTQFDWVSLKLREAQIYFSAGQHSAALTSLDQVVTHPNIRRDIRVNAMVNRAAMLAELGQGAEALALIDAALEIFQDSGLQLTGSDRQFAWIRACALHQLGRTTEAETAIKPLRNAPEFVGDPGVLQPPTSGIALRAALCLGDDAWVASMAESSNLSIDYFAISLQPHFRTANPRQQATLDAARARLADSPVMARFRVLPDSYRAALNNWVPARIAPVDPSPAS